MTLSDEEVGQILGIMEDAEWSDLGWDEKWKCPSCDAVLCDGQSQHREMCVLNSMLKKFKENQCSAGN